MTILCQAVRSACLLAAAGALSACAATATLVDAPVRDASFTLAPQRSIALSPAASLHFDSVADSRCPRDVKCVWAGKVVYRFTLRSQRGSESFSLEPAAPRHASSALPGVTIALSGASSAPPEKSADTAAPAPVSLAVTVGK